MKTPTYIALDKGVKSMSRKGSVVFQIQQTVLQNTIPEMSEKHIQANRIPTSRSQAKKQGKADQYIFSYADGKRVMQTINRIAKYNDIQDIAELRAEHVDRYIQKKIDDGCSSGYIRTEKYAAQKFAKCLLNTGKRSKHDPSIESSIVVPSGQGRTRGGRYTAEEKNQILNYIKDNESKEKYSITKIQSEAGLRVSEVTNLKAKNIDIQEEKIIIRKEDNISKGGRPREIPIDQKTKKYLKKIKENKTGNDRLFGTSKRMMQKTVQKACKAIGIQCRGPHGFRGEYAYRKLKEALKKKGLPATDARIQKIVEKHGNALTEKEKSALREVSKLLGHNRIRVVRERYIIR